LPEDHLDGTAPWPERLSGVRAKLDRADVHLAELTDSIDEWRESDPCQVVSREDPYTGDCVLRGEVLKKPDRTYWGVLIGDCVQNLRASLDYLVYELARIEQSRFGRRNDPHRTGFPILTDPGSLENELRTDGRQLGRLALVAGDVQCAVIALQPFKRRPRRAWSDPLAVLNALANSDKHRLLHVAQHATSAASYSLDLSLEFGVDIAAFQPLGAFEHDDEIERLPALPRCAEIAAQLNLTFDVAFDPEGPGRGGLVVSQLAMIRDDIRSEVVPRFVEFFD
jgi:hypothetical protein